MTGERKREHAHRPYTAPRLIRPEAEGLSPEGKVVFSTETTFLTPAQFGPS